MRTTIRLNEQLLAEAKQYAAKNQRSFTSVVEDALRLLLHKRELSTDGYQEPIVDTGNGLQPGVNLNDNAALSDLMEAWDAVN